ncbi:MAG: FG-GAP repeat protein [bacterium]
MFHFRRSLLFCFICLFLAGELVLTPLGTTYSQRKSESGTRAQDQGAAQSPDADDDGALEQEDSAQDRNDPCDHHLIDPPGKALGIDKKCARGGGSSGIAKGDFNGDGFGDLAVGVPREDVNGEADAGAVNIIYGSNTSGLCATGGCVVIPAQVWSQDSSGVPGGAEAGDKFGSALAAGDFNGDGCSDLAIGVPGEEYTWFGFGIPSLGSGVVNVIYGSNAGLVASGTSSAQCGAYVGVPAPRIFDFGDLRVTSLSVKGQYRFGPGSEDKFGSSLAWGDFDKDGKGDLAIGIPDWDVQQDSMLCNPTIKGAGAVAVLAGSGAGLQGPGDLWTQHGLALQLYDDESLGLFCSNGDIDISHDAFFSFETVANIAIPADIVGVPEADDHFGSSLAAGDFNGDGCSDLAIGVPFEDIAGVYNAGGVNVLYGCTRIPEYGLLFSTGNQFWSQGASGINGTPESMDSFGSSLAAGDFNGDGKDDLAVGVPKEDVGSLVDAGAVNIIYGSGNRLTDVGDQLIDANSLSRSPVVAAQQGAQFGFSLAAGVFHTDLNSQINGTPPKIRDLAIGAPFFDLSFPIDLRVVDAGVVAVVTGFSDGLRPTVNQILYQTVLNQCNYPGVLCLNGSLAEDGDQFGFALTAWNFGRSTHADLAIGVPGESLSETGLEAPSPLLNIPRAGLVNVIYGSLNGLSLTGNQRWSQASAGVPGEVEVGDAFGRVLY